MNRGYAPLWCKSNYSFLEGASHPEELMAQAAFLRLPAIAITDRNGVYGLPRAHQRCLELESGIDRFSATTPKTRLLCGAQVHIQEESPLLLLVQDLQGWKNLCLLLSQGAALAEKGQNKVTLEDIAHHSGGMLALWGGFGSSLYDSHRELWREHGEVLIESFGDRLYAFLTRHKRAEEKRLEPMAVKRAESLGLSVVAGREVLYHQPERRRLQDVLTCIREGCSLSQAGQRLRPNAEYGLLASEDFYRLYADREEAVWKTLEVASRCDFSLSQLTYRYPDEPLPDGRSSSQWLRELVFQGAERRYPEGVDKKAKALLEKELSLISSLDYVGYFLTMYEIVRFCQRSNILCQGRGSAANSLVCYCLGITAVDPVKLGLLFERFISAERAEPPDIDLDISHQRREEVISWVYERYGRRHAAMVCNVVRYRARSAVREVGKVLQVELPVIERLARLLTGYSADLEAQVVEGAGLEMTAPTMKLLVELVNEIMNFPRHLSIHPGGFLLGGDPVCELVPIEKATMEGRTVIQWDKYDVDNLGLFKVDLLGLGALSQLHRAFALLRRHLGLELSMATLPVDDPATFAMLSRGDSVGVFQIESRAQMAMLPALRPRCFYDLVIQVAIIRPGPITGGMVNPYLRRRSGEEEIEYPHKILIPVLEKSLGIPLFQEQVMKIAMLAADYTPGEADQLRRDMAAWSSHGKLERHRERLITRMVSKGIAQEFAERIFAQIKGFGEYGFPESHAASFALITYATSYLRCHYPEVFTCALLNSLPMGFYSASTLLEDAKRKGVKILGFCVEKSAWDCQLEELECPSRGASVIRESHQQLELLGLEDSFYQRAARQFSKPRLALRLGFKLLKGFKELDAQRLVEARPFKSVREMTLKARLDRRALESLSSVGALSCYGSNRRTSLWAVDDHLQAQRSPLLSELEEDGSQFPDLSLDERVLWDFEHSGLSAEGHPLESLRPQLKKAGYPTARAVQRIPHGRKVRFCAVVICRQRPATAKGTVFLTMEDETGFVNVILWPKIFKEHYVVARSARLLAIKGQLQSARGVVHLVAEKLWIPEFDEALKVELTSRNFH